MARASRIVAAPLIALLSFGAVAAPVLWLVDSEAIFRFTLSFERDLQNPYFDVADMIAIQRRAAAARVVCLVLAVALVMVGPGPWVAVLADAIASARDLKRRITSHAPTTRTRSCGATRRTAS